MVSAIQILPLLTIRHPIGSVTAFAARVSQTGAGGGMIAPVLGVGEPDEAKIRSISQRWSNAIGVATIA